MIYRIPVCLVVIMLVLGCSRAVKENPRTPLYDGLSGFHRTVTTSSEEAQHYFDQGLTLYYGFNHEAAIRSFQQAIALDSTCAMAWWGQAISAGPNINNPVMDSTAKIAAWHTVIQAQNYRTSASPLEKLLIEALSKRYSWPAPTDRKSLDSAYAASMREVYLAYPDDPDVGTLFADALLNLRPWDYWTSDGKPQPGTLELVSVLEHVLKMYPGHPGACHFYIHAMEASPFPELALAAADSLRNRVPGAGHLVHMPSHIYVRLGRYKDAIEANQKAIMADSIWIPEGGFYTIYRAHNYHFLAYAAMFDGQKNLALAAAYSMINKIPMDMVRSFPDFLDGFMAVPIHVMVRFGMWDEILNYPRPDPGLYLTQAFWHYGRAIAYAAKGNVDEARAENDSLALAYNQVPETRLIGNNPGKTVLDIGVLMARGELEYRQGNYDEAFAILRQAVEKDDALKYDEPWGWMMPVRHALGALLLEQRHLEEAEQVYFQDLKIHPDNGWALKGLADCYKVAGQVEEATYAEARFRKAWSRSDTRLSASCFCSKGVD